MLTPADLNGQDYIGFDEDLSIRQALDRFFREHGVTDEPGHAVRQYPDDQGSGGARLGHQHSARAHHAGRDPTGRLVSIRLDAPDLVRPVGIVHRKRKKFNRAAQVFLDLLRERPERLSVPQ